MNTQSKAMAITVFLGTSIAATAAFADDYLVFNTSGAPRLQMWTLENVGSAQGDQAAQKAGRPPIEGTAKFRFRQGCTLEHYSPTGQRFYADPDCDVQASYVDLGPGHRFVAQQITMNANGEQQMIYLRFMRCERDPFIRWNSGAVRCAPPAEFSLSRLGPSLQGRPIYFADPRNPRDFPVGWGIVSEQQARAVVLNQRRPVLTPPPQTKAHVNPSSPLVPKPALVPPSSAPSTPAAPATSGHAIQRLAPLKSKELR